MQSIWPFLCLASLSASEIVLLHHFVSILIIHSRHSANFSLFFPLFQPTERITILSTYYYGEN